jgi:hypothetical protein
MFFLTERTENTAIMKVGPFRANKASGKSEENRKPGNILVALDNVLVK